MGKSKGGNYVSVRCDWPHSARGSASLPRTSPGCLESLRSAYTTGKAARPGRSGRSWRQSRLPAVLVNARCRRDLRRLGGSVMRTQYTNLAQWCCHRSWTRTPASIDRLEMAVDSGTSC